MLVAVSVTRVNWMLVDDGGKGALVLVLEKQRGKKGDGRRRGEDRRSDLGY